MKEQFVPIFQAVISGILNGIGLATLLFIGYVIWTGVIATWLPWRLRDRIGQLEHDVYTHIANQQRRHGKTK